MCVRTCVYVSRYRCDMDLGNVGHACFGFLVCVCGGSDSLSLMQSASVSQLRPSIPRQQSSSIVRCIALRLTDVSSLVVVIATTTAVSRRGLLLLTVQCFNSNVPIADTHKCCLVTRPTAKRTGSQTLL